MDDQELRARLKTLEEAVSTLVARLPDRERTDFREHMLNTPTSADDRKAADALVRRIEALKEPGWTMEGGLGPTMG